jgi:hypothetical protein
MNEKISLLLHLFDQLKEEINVSNYFALPEFSKQLVLFYRQLEYKRVYTKWT